MPDPEITNDGQGGVPSEPPVEAFADPSAEGTPAEPTAAEPGQAPEYDLSSIKVSVGEGPDGEMSVEQLREAYFESRKAMAATMEEKAQIQQEYKWASDLRTYIDQDPNFRNYLQAYGANAGGNPQSQYYYDDYGNPMQPAPAPQNVGAPVTAESIRLQELETKYASITLNQDLDKLKSDLKESYGLSLDDAQRATIFEEVARTGNPNVNDIYWGRFGKDIVKSVQKRVKKDTAEKIQKNNQSYDPAPPTPASSKAPGIADMKFGSPEFNQVTLDGISKILGGG